MYDADEQAFYDEQDASYRDRHPDQFEVRDSGKKAVYADGNQRDDPGDKPRFDLLYPRGMEYEETLLYRTAMHYMRGGRKYGDRNWEKSSTEESLLAHETALHRHFTKFALGIEDGEDHAAAIVWNLQAILYTRWRLRQRVEAEVPQLTPDELMDKLRGGSVNSDNTEEIVEAAIQRLEAAPVFKTYVFPVKPGNAYASHFNQITIKALNLEAARRELDAMLGHTTAEASAELDRQQDEAEDEHKAMTEDWFEVGDADAGTEDIQMVSGAAVHDVTGPPKMNEMPCIDCHQQKCKYGEGRCEDCQRTNATARWQKNAAMIGGPCPDGGTCHHGCIEQSNWPCYRVLTCGPLSGVMPNDQWPPEVVQHNNDKEASRLLTEQERNSQ